MAASKSPRARLLHIRDEIEGVAIVIRGLSFAQYQGSYLHRRAVERAVQIVSEAAKALPRDYLRMRSCGLLRRGVCHRARIRMPGLRLTTAWER
jgi:hypothetical protein